MARYLTRRYVAIDWAGAVRLAELDGTPLNQIDCNPEARLIHRTEWWAWWSDQRLTMAIGIPEDLQPQGLSPDAVELITDSWLSDSLPPWCGWNTLARVQQIISSEVLSIGPARGIYRPETWERLTVKFVDGQLGVLYRFWLGYEEGYLYQVTLEPPRGLEK